MKKNIQRFAYPEFFFFLFIVAACHTVAAQEQMTERPVPPLSPGEGTAPLEALPSMDISNLKVLQGVSHSLPVCDFLYEQINEIPAFSDNLFQAMIGSQHQIPELFHITYSLLGAKAGGYGPPLSNSWQGKTIRTEADIESFFGLEGVGLEHPEEWEKLPFSLRKEIIEFLYYMDRANTTIHQFIAPVCEFLVLDDMRNRDDTREILMAPWNMKELSSWETIGVIDLADFKKLSYASRIAGEKLGWFLTGNDLSLPGDFTSCSITSCMGECLINGTGNDTIEGDKFCVIELGGHDVYRGNTAAPVSISQPVGMVIDLNGNDQYLCDENFLVSALLGLAFLIDVSGDDYYRTNKPGLSSSLYGSALLYDFSGDDTYISGSSCSQAASYVGTSLFFDISGDDTYQSSSCSLGFGGTKGVSVFYNGNGADLYNSDAGDHSNVNTHLSFTQGAAQGRWAEATDGQSLAGGIGIFFDSHGSDAYRAHGFSQGASYYFGLGLFSDLEGDDSYTAISHSQGYAGHYALASFLENAGDDCYNLVSDAESLTQVIGGGRDNSAGIFIDRKGNDTYHFGNRSAGIGDLNGIGILADFGGADQYFWIKNCMNKDAPSAGKKIDEGDAIGLSFRVIQQKNIATGLFFDSNGDHISEK